MRKPTGFMSNSAAICEELDRKCHGRHGLCSGRHAVEGKPHGSCTGKTAEHAEKYSDVLCRCILKGISKELHDSGLCVDGEVGMMKPELRETVAKVNAFFEEVFRDIHDGLLKLSDELEVPNMASSMVAAVAPEYVAHSIHDLSVELPAMASSMELSTTS